MVTLALDIKQKRKKHNSDVVKMETEDFKINSYPEDNPEPQGFTIKGKSKPYLRAHSNLKIMMKKGVSYYIGGRKMDIKDVDTKFKGGVNVEVEITAKNGKSGKAKLTIYNEGKKPTATIQVSNKADGFKFQRILAIKIITPLLEGFISGEVTRKTITDYKKSPLETTIGKDNTKNQETSFACQKCSKKFQLNRTLKSHVTRMHKDSTPEKVLDKPITKICTKCDLKFDEDVDFETHLADHLSIETQTKQK